MSRYEKATIEELQMWRANAHKTYMLAGGHGKATRNEYAYARLTDEIVKRGVTPDDTIDGVFNGDGAV